MGQTHHIGNFLNIFELGPIFIFKQYNDPERLTTKDTMMLVAAALIAWVRHFFLLVWDFFLFVRTVFL